MSDNPTVEAPARAFCATCNHVTTPYYHRCPKCEGDRNRAKVDALAEVIRALKATVEIPIGSGEEAYLKSRLVDLDHPDVKGFTQWLDDARAARRR